MYLGDSIKIISDFVIRSLLLKYKAVIDSNDLTETETELGIYAVAPIEQKVEYVPRVYSTYNSTKHTILFTYVAEEAVSKKQHHVGSVSYNTVEQKWVSRMSKGVKFMYPIQSSEYLSGIENPYKIWEADTLVDPLSNKYMRNNQQGEEVPCSFEIVVNEYPMFEKILDSLQLICNKNIPDRIELITFGEYNQAADEIWGESPDILAPQDASFDTNLQERKVVQGIVSRDVSTPAISRSSIIHQNAYYKNNSLYIEVGKVSSFIKDVDNKRIRDKAIKVRFVYTGSDALFIQSIISILRLSSN